MLLLDATHSHPADSGIQPALHSSHHKARDEEMSAEQKETRKVYYILYLRAPQI